MGLPSTVNASQTAQFLKNVSHINVVLLDILKNVLSVILIYIRTIKNFNPIPKNTIYNHFLCFMAHLVAEKQ